MNADCPFIDRVPKDPIENMRWRLKMRRLALRDKELQRALFDAAMSDVLFWFNAFCWCFEPRARVKIKPFVTWAHQDNPIVVMDNAISEAERSGNPTDVVCDKSRAQGATWMYLCIFARRFIRDPMFSAGLVTRNEKLVDSATDSDTLLWKVDWLLKRLPQWMLPGGFSRNLSEHTITNPENSATFVGFSATGDVGRGGRKTVFALDEIGSIEFISAGKDYQALDATRSVANCQFLVSTFGGDSGAFHEAATSADSSAIKVVLDWRDNPTQNEFSYSYAGGRFKAVRPPEQPDVDAYAKRNKEKLKRLERRGFKMEGLVRSPWYDQQCLRPGATPRSIARELDRNPRGSASKVFDTFVLDMAARELCKPPLHRGRAALDLESFKVARFIETDSGELSLWCDLGVDGGPPPGKYIVACDIAVGSTGEYSSNSVAHILNAITGEQVGEWASRGIDVKRFARIACSLSKWFHNALLNWEANGAGVGFTEVVMDEVGYENIYYREVNIEGLHRKTKRPGYWTQKEDVKLALFESLSIAISDGGFIPRSADMIGECGQYEFKNGRIVFVPKAKNPNGDGFVHGDRAMAAAIAYATLPDIDVTNTPDDDDEVEPSKIAESLDVIGIARRGRVDPWTGDDIRSQAGDDGGFLLPGLILLQDPWGG